MRGAGLLDRPDEAAFDGDVPAAFDTQSRGIKEPSSTLFAIDKSP